MLFFPVPVHSNFESIYNTSLSTLSNQVSVFTGRGVLLNSFLVFVYYLNLKMRVSVIAILALLVLSALSVQGKFISDPLLLGGGKLT